MIRTSLKYLCPAKHIPAKIEVDVSNLDIGDKVSMNDVVHPSLKFQSRNETIPLCKIMSTNTENSEAANFKRKEQVAIDNQLLELWKAADLDGSIGLIVCKSKKITSPSADKFTDFHLVKSINKQKDKCLISGALIEIQDLKRKREITVKNKRGKVVIECEKLKGQLEESDMTILKLFDLNKKLMKRVGNSSFFNVNSSFESDEDGSANRRRISVQMRRMSEKIARLQLVVQTLQFVLLKLDSENEVGG
ncbi:protein NETWORKED 1D [Abeliophyllum distichum]|uniref:Protein NETWORKED 1D n=1 Tax=Abeliophyllum distichum TaxID=126358 RepID=A0ABD1U097_9LAMI